MKRVLAFLAAASALLMVSCTKELNKFDGNTGGLQKVSFKVSTEGAITKVVSFGTGTLAGAAETGELIVQAFVLGSDNQYTLMPNAKITISDPNAGKWDVDLQLAKGETYRIAFWAQKKETGIYNTADLSAVTVDYSKVAINSDNADAFCATRELKVTGTLTEVVELKRPLAQINVGTNDRTVYNNSVPEAKQALSGKVTLSGGVPSKINLIGATTAVEGVVAYTVTGETEDETVFGPTAANGADETIGEHNNLFMLYVLADPEKQMMDFSVAIENAVNPMCKIDVSNLPFRANYRTNILGQLLTGDVHYDVEIVPGFNTPDYDKLVEPGFASVSAMNAYLATMLDQTCEGDNGDIDPEVVILKADAVVGDEEVIELPKISGKIVFHILADCKKLTFKYADGATDAQKPAFVDLCLGNVELLVIDLDDSHVELVTGVIEDIEVITGPDTFVIKQGAKVGNAVIKQGNAVVDGTVDAVEVAAGASADGQGAPVEVFLSNESAVKQIELNAPTDVVVEQPKDNIDESNTENKVEVQVNVNDCSATAQNGGQIYVKVGAGVTCSVAADGESEAQPGQDPVPSGVTIASVGEGSSVDTYEDEAGKIVYDGVNEDQINKKDFQASIGDQHFMTVLEAYEAAKAGDTVVILVEEFEKITSGSFAINPVAAIADDCWYIYDASFDRPYEVHQYDGIVIRYDSAKTAMENGTNLWNTIQNDGKKYFITEGTWELNNGQTSRFINKSFSLAGIGDKENVIIKGSERYAMVFQASAEGYVVNLSNLTLLANTAWTPLYVKDYMTVNATNLNLVTEGETVILLDSANTLEQGVKTTVNASQISAPDKYVEFCANPCTSVPNPDGIVTYCEFNYDETCAFFGCKAQDICLSTGDNLIVNGVALPVPPKVFNVSTPAEFVEIFSSNAIKTRNTQININDDIDLSSEEAHSPIDISNMDKASITVNGNNHIIKGMKKPMFDQCFVASIAVSDLTFKDCKITEASEGYVAVIAAYFDAGRFLNIENVTFDNCDLTGSNYAGLVYGSGGGYGNQNDGPVHMGAFVKNCSANGCDLESTGGGSVGGIAGHAAWNNWTKLTVENCSITNSTMTTSKANKAGSFFGTLGTAGYQNPLYGEDCGIYVKDCYWSGNDVKANDVASTYIFGRIGSNNGSMQYYDEDGYVMVAYRTGDVDYFNEDKIDLVREDRFSLVQ